MPARPAPTRGPRVVGLAEVAALAGVSKARAAELARLDGFPAATELAQGKVWSRGAVEAFLAAWRAGPARRKATRLPAGWQQAEAWVHTQLRHALGSAAETIAGPPTGQADRGVDLCVELADGRQILVQVKAISNPRASRGDFTVGRLPTEPERNDTVIAFVDMTSPQPWPVYLAGANTVARLARERHTAYHEARGRDPAQPGPFPTKISRTLLERMGTRDWWELLLEQDPADLPPPEPYLDQARREAPQPRTAPR